MEPFLFVGTELFIIFTHYPFNVHGISSNGPSFISTISKLICVFSLCSSLAWGEFYLLFILYLERNFFGLCSFSALPSFFSVSLVSALIYSSSAFSFLSQVY